MVHIRHKRGRIATTATRHLHRKITTARASYPFYDFENGGPVAVATVERGARAAAAQISKSGRVGFRKIGDVNVVAYAGSIGRRIIVSEDAHFRPLADRG